MLSITRNQPKCYEILDSMNLSEWEIQDYLKSNRFTKEYQQVLFSLRNKTYPFKINFKQQYINDMRCRICQAHHSIENYEHTRMLKLRQLVQPTQLLKLDYVYGNKKTFASIQAFIAIH